MRYIFAWIFCICYVSIMFISTEARHSSRRKKQRPSSSNTDMTETMKYLKKYGYMNLDTDIGRPITSTDDPRFMNGVQRMQEYFHLLTTGKMDRQMMKILRQPRCGFPDVMDGNAVMLGRRLPQEYNLAGRRYKWERTDLTFQYLNYPSGQSTLQPEKVREIIHKAFKLWSDVTPLTFREVDDLSEGADIKIKFGRGHHHPEEPKLASFDGMGGELAHAFAPNSFWGDLEGDVHFDDDENFTADGKKGFALLLVATHEIGHSLGLAHSDESDSLMWPNYKYVPVKGYRLPRDDVRGIQALYGRRPDERFIPELEGIVDNPSQPIEDTTDKQRAPDGLSSVCQDPVTALLKVDDELFVFRDNMVWRIRIQNRQLISHPKGEPANRYWKGIPSGINAAYRRQDGNVVFFKGAKYYVYKGKKRVSRPSRISTMGLGRPPMAALRANQLAPHKVYLVRGNEVWLYNEDTGAMEAGYPRAVNELWSDLPSGITGGEMMDNGSALFIKGNKYFEVNSNNHVTSSPAGSSKLFSIDFIGCPPS